MQPYWQFGWAFVVALMLTGASPIQAAWCNVFQACCHRDRGARTSVGFFAAPDPCCNPCPQVCTTHYVQRCYYQPVTSYQTKTYYEPVTTYRTSYYYEPVTSYRYSCYFDPCTCSYQQVACPTTTYRLRSRCCPVQSWVQRCCQVPVTTYRATYYYEPVTSCSNPCAACPTVAVASDAGCCGGTPGVQEQRSGASIGTPGVHESREGVNRNFNSPGTSYYNPPSASPKMNNNSYRHDVPSAPVQPPPTVKLDQIAVLPSHNLEGQIVRNDRVPAAGAKVTFIHADRKETQQLVTTDRSGRFRATLASGGWLMYVEGPDGQPVFQNKVEVGSGVRQVTLTSR